MRTVAQAFEQMVQSLELTENEKAEASRQQAVVRENLRVNLGGISRDFLSGSYSRNTAIRPLHDIDLVIVLDSTRHAALRMNGPGACLAAVRRALVAAYPNKELPILQNRSVHIDFSGTGIGYDVVPAFEIAPFGVHQIPDRDRGGWITTNPELHKQMSTDANERAGKKLKPLIKVAKHWNREHGQILRSFHLEVMAWSAFSAPPYNYMKGLGLLFDHLACRVGDPCPAPGGGGTAVDQGMDWSKRQQAARALSAAAAMVRQAIQTEGWSLPDAHRQWQGLLGPLYKPE